MEGREVVATSEMESHEDAKVGVVRGREGGRKLFVLTVF